MARIAQHEVWVVRHPWRLPAPPDMQKMAMTGADLQTAPLKCGSVIRFNASANDMHCLTYSGKATLAGSLPENSSPARFCGMVLNKGYSYFLDLQGF